MSMENMTENAAGTAAGNTLENEAGAVSAASAATEESASGKTAKKQQAGIGKLFGGGKKQSRGKAEKGRNSEEDIKKLTRTELLELLIDETKEADRLRADNERLREELKRCHEDLDRIASFEAVIARLESIVNGR